MANGSDSINTRDGMSYLFQKTKEQWLAEGDAHYQVKRFEEALEAYENVLLLDPNDAAVYNHKGFALLKLRRNEEAFDAFSKARAAYEFHIYLHPNDAEGYTGKGLALHGLNRTQEALIAFEQAIELDPSNAEA